METTVVAGGGVLLLRSSIIFVVLIWVVFLMRVAVRLSRKAFGLDDYLMSIGVCLLSVLCGIGISLSHYGSGQLASQIPPLAMQRGVKTFYIGQFFYSSSAMFIKMSVAVTLLRISSSRQSITWALYFLMGIICITTVIFVVGTLNVCHPINAMWGESKGKCNLPLINHLSVFYSAIEILTDVGLSIIPAVLLWNIQMKSKVKAGVIVMLTLASFASCATIIRLKYLTLYNDSATIMYGSAMIGFWSLTEAAIGIIAGSLPALRPVLSMRIKITTSTHTPAASANGYPTISSKRSLRRPAAYMLDDFHTLNDNDATDHSDHESQRNIIKETDYTVTSTPRYPEPLARVGSYH